MSRELGKPKTIEELEEDVQSLANLSQNLMVNQIKLTKDLEELKGQLRESLQVIEVILDASKKKVNTQYNPIEETK